MTVSPSIADAASNSFSPRSAPSYGAVRAAYLNASDFSVSQTARASSQSRCADGPTASRPNKAAQALSNVARPAQTCPAFWSAGLATGTRPAGSPVISAHRPLLICAAAKPSKAAPTSSTNIQARPRSSRSLREMAAASQRAWEAQMMESGSSATSFAHYIAQQIIQSGGDGEGRASGLVVALPVCL